MKFTKRSVTTIAVRLGIASILLFCSAQVHAQVQLPPAVHQQFFSAAGVPLAGGCVFTYTAGTTTPLATFTDFTGAVPNSNPVILDVGGFANIWLTSGSAYKFQAYSAGGVNCATGTSQWTVDGITSSSASGGSTATALTSATSNPATSGIVRLAKSDTLCWRNAGNSANLCLSLDSANNLTWGGESLALTEGTPPSGVSGEDILYADPTAHRLKMTNNAGAATQVVASGADINTSDQVTTTHLAAALPVSQGGTASTTATGSGSVVLQTNPTLTLGGVNISQAPSLVWSGFIPTNSINASNTTSFSAWTTLNPITIKAFTINGIVGLVSGCSPFPAYSIEDNGSIISTITYTGASSYTGTGFPYNMAAGHSLTINQTTAGTSCSTGAFGEFNVVYQMQ